MQLIDEQYYPALAALYFIKNGLKPFLEFAPELCARNKGAHVKGEYLAVLQVCRHIAGYYPLGKPLGYCRLAYARLAYEHGVILGLS